VNTAPYRARPESLEERYARAWAANRKRRRRLWIAFFAWAPLTGLLVTLGERLTGASERVLGPYLALPIGLSTFALLQFLFWGMKCPNCGKNPYVRRMYSNAFSSECLNCGIRIGAGPPPRGPQAPHVSA
jgi:hypothetical protein